MAAAVILLVCCLSLHSVYDVGEARRPGQFSWPRGVPRGNPLWKRFWDRFRPKQQVTTVPPTTTTSQPTTTTSRPTTTATQTTPPPPDFPVHDSRAISLCETKEFINSLSCKLEREYPDIQEGLLTTFGEKLFLEPDRRPAGSDGAGTRSCAKIRKPTLHDKKGEELEFDGEFPDIQCETSTFTPSIDKQTETGLVPEVGRPDPETAFNPCGYSATMVSPIHAVTVSGETVELWAGIQRGVVRQQKFREVKCTSSTPNHQGCEGRCVEESTWHRAIVVKSGDPPKVGYDMIVVKASCSCHVITSKNLFSKQVLKVPLDETKPLETKSDREASET